MADTKCFDKEITFGQKYDAAMRITDQAEADAYFERCVKHTMTFGKDGAGVSRPEAERIERSNLGYYAGYYDAETMQRVNRIFNTRHPIFGLHTPSAKEAFETGKALGASDA